jgi:predicted hydrocarbon binding protein
MERKVRGSVLNAYFNFIEKKWGHGGLDQCKVEIGIDNPFADGQYYHDEIRENILRWLSRVKGAETIPEAGRSVVKNLGILSWIVRYASPQMIAKKFPDNYSEVYTFGRIESNTDKSDEIVLRLYDVNRIKESCSSWLGVCMGALEMTKRKGVVTETKCQVKGDKYCEYHIKLQ